MGKTAEQLALDNAAALQRQQDDQAWQAQLTAALSGALSGAGAGVVTPVTPTPIAPVVPKIGPAQLPAGWSQYELPYSQGYQPSYVGQTPITQQGNGVEFYTSQKGAVDLGANYLEDIQNLINYMKQPVAAGADSFGAPQDAGEITVGEQGTLLEYAQRYGISPTQLAEMYGDPNVTAADVKSILQASMPHNAYNYLQGFAKGGIASLPAAGRYLGGPTDGMADKIPSSIEGEQEAALSHGEFVIPADVVSHLGNGNSEAGAESLYKMMDRIRTARTGNKEQGRKIDPDAFTQAR